MKTFIEILLAVLVYTAFFGIPTAAIVCFIVSLVKFRKADRSDTEAFQKCRKRLIITSWISGILVLVITALLILAALAMANM